MVRKSPWKKEWVRLLKAEAKYIDRRKDGPMSVLFKKLDKIIPKKLSRTINAALFKAFNVIFNKGTGVIERTYNKKKKEKDFMVNVYASKIFNDPRSVRKFTRKAKRSIFLNVLLAFVEGAGMGILGLAVFDIPIFLMVTLKSIYEVALAYGYDYHTEEDKVFILKLMETAMSDEDIFVSKDEEINGLLDYIIIHGDEIPKWNIELSEQTRISSDCIASELIYTRVIQKIPIVGVVGGLFNATYVGRISKYALVKYRRRFIGKKIYEEEHKDN